MEGDVCTQLLEKTDSEIHIIEVQYGDFPKSKSILVNVRNYYCFSYAKLRVQKIHFVVKIKE